MFGEVRYSSDIQKYECVYEAPNRKLAKWIADKYMDEDYEISIFAYQSRVILLSGSEELIMDFRDRLNIELEDIMEGKEEVEIQCKVPLNLSLNQMRLTRRSSF